MNRKKLMIGLIIGAALIILAGFFLFRYFSSSSEKQLRSNMIKLIRLDYKAGDYERALDKLDQLLLKYINDDELLELRSEINQAKNDQEQQEQEQIDAREQEAMQKIMEQMSETIEKQDKAPIIIRTNQPEKEDDSKSKAENEKRKKINQLLNEGLEALNNQNFARAKSKFLEVLKMDENNAEANALLARTLYEENPEDERNIEEAVKKAKKALKKDDDIEQAHYTLAKIYDKKGLIDLAEEEYLETVKLNPQNYDALYSLGKIYFKQKKYNPAYTQFYNAVQIKKDFVNAFLYLGRTTYKLKDYHSAIKHYNKTISLDPKYQHAYSDLGQTYFIIKDYKNSLNNYLKAAALENKYYYHKRIGQCYEKLNDLNHAIESHIQSVSLNPAQNKREINDAIESYVSIAKNYIALQNFNEAIGFAMKGLQLETSNPDLYFLSALAKSRSNDLEGAIQDYQNAINYDRKDIASYINLSRLYNEMANFESAIQTALDGLKIRKSFELFNNLGDSYQKQEQYQDAINAYQSAIAINKRNADIFFNLGTCYKKLENHTKAVASYRNAINHKKNFYDAYYELGESYFLLEQFEEAKTILDLLIQKKPDYTKRARVDSMLSVING